MRAAAAGADAPAVPIDFDTSLANFDLDDVGLCEKSWAKIRVASPPPTGRASHSATALDSFCFCVIGGGICSASGHWSHFADAHVFDVRTRTWLQLSPAPDAQAGAFTARRGHAAALWRGAEVVVFGGTSGATGMEGTLNDCWVLDVTLPAWRRLRHRGEVPRPRRGALGCCAAGVFLVVGGYTWDFDCNLYALAPETEVWSKVLTRGLPMPPFALAAGTTVGNNVYVFGGSPPAGFLWLRLHTRTPGKRTAIEDETSDDRSPLSHVEVIPCDIRGEAPCARYCHGMAPIAGRWLLVFGGTEITSLDTPGQTLNDCYLLDLRRCSGGAPFLTGRCVALRGPGEAAPPNRNGFAMVGFGTKFVVHGGGVYQEVYYDDAWVLDLHLSPAVAIPDATPGADVGMDLAWLRDSEEGQDLCDVELDVGSDTSRRLFRAHRAVLCARSDYFRALLAGGFREASRTGGRIALPDLDPDAFELVLAYTYTGRLPVPEPNADEHAEEEEVVAAALDADLCTAALCGDGSAVGKALAAGADPNTRDRTGLTPLHLASSTYPLGPSDAASAEVVRLLCGAGADVKLATPEGQTAVQLAARCKRREVSRALIEALRGAHAPGGDMPTDNAAAAPAPQAPAAPQAHGGAQAGGLQEDASTVLGVLLSADRLGQAHLALLCERWLARALRPSNVCELLEVAEEFRCSQLRLICLHFFKRRRRCLRSPGFAALPQHLKDEVSWACQSV